MKFLENTGWFILLAFLNKMFRDSMPLLDIRPLLRKVWDFIITYFTLGIAYIVWWSKTPSKNQQTQTGLILAAVVLVILYRMQQLEHQNKQKSGFKGVR